MLFTKKPCPYVPCPYVQCPISSSLGEFPSYWDWLWCPELSPVLVSIPLPFAFNAWCFPFVLICHWISIVFLLYGRRIATHSVDPSLTHCLQVSFQAWDWLWYPMLWSQRRNKRCAWSRKLDPNFYPGRVEPRAMASSGVDVATRLPRTPPFSRLLGGYSRTILTPNLLE